jgi:iron(III) transport system ATP-binding protein
VTSVQLNGITAGYGGAPVLTELDLSVISGEFIAILGSSGSGKTTLLRVIAGFLKPISGTVAFGHHIVSSSKVWVPPEKRKVGIVPQEGALFPHLDVIGNIAFGVKKSPHAETRVLEVLEMVGMSDYAKARPQELSGGQQQRIALARALAPRPEVLLLDEPFTALDAGLRTSLRSEVRQLLSELGTTSILVTHDQEEALSIADRVAVMRNGQLIQLATPLDLYEDPINLDVARFVGELVELSAEMISPQTVRTSLGDLPVKSGSVANSTDLIAVLRPEQLSVEATTVGDQSAISNGTVMNVNYHGHDSLVEVRLHSGEHVAIRVPGDSTVQPGEPVHVKATGNASTFPVVSK